ncbi:MAG: hypothetical protein ACRDIB_05010, partial [Ardenticatenaceae bacterium]
MTEEERARAIASWFPDPDNPASMNHLFRSRYENFDVVPEVTGTYEALMGAAVLMRAFGYDIWVAHLDELLATLTVPRRKKDVARVRQLREIQR